MKENKLRKEEGMALLNKNTSYLNGSVNLQRKI